MERMIGSTRVAAARNQAGRQRDRASVRVVPASKNGICAGDLIEREARRRPRAAHPRDQRTSDEDGLHSLREDEPQNVPRLCSQGHAHANLAGALLNRATTRHKFRRARGGAR